MKSTSRRACVRATLAAVGIAVSAGALAPRASSAQSTALGLRRELVDQAQAALASGDRAGALALAERALRIESTPSVQFFVAERHAELGHSGPALLRAQQCIVDATRAATLNNREEILAACRRVATAARELVGRLVVSVEGAAEAPSATLVIEGTEVPSEARDLPFPVSPGTVLVELRRGSERLVAREVTVASGATVSVTIAVPAATLTAPAVTLAPPAPVVVRRGLPWGAVALGALGLGALGAGGGFFAAQRGAYDELAGRCDDTDPAFLLCDETLANRAQRAQVDVLGGVATGLVLTGGALLVGGAVWFAIDRGRGASTPSVERPGALTLGPRGLAVRW